ncbi:uncharacterized protein EKO05_0010335 [Ascochyta rabiei]|uniref:uncharacterized protein n=1 Tax=Didymella rabiei TaxID=5454 RepID=UPI00220B48A0|nr:uncharacterized protein EKO05_0010335 [Ascochyta rabiei]UPX20090.1 hypothetical protein EKO05_0010335 [Ascochyta rabiei]
MVLMLKRTITSKKRGRSVRSTGGCCPCLALYTPFPSTNIANARGAGMGADLALHVGDRYTIALVKLSPTYFPFELPSSIVLRKVGSANWLAFIALS